MGSTGTGSLTDYPGSRGGGVSGGGSSQGSSNTGQCDASIVEQLEEVAICDYYKNHNDVPPSSTVVQVEQKARISVTTASGELIGYLPTKFNYLAACLAEGFTYSGTVKSSAKTRVPVVLVELLSNGKK